MPLMLGTWFWSLYVMDDLALIIPFTIYLIFFYTFAKSVFVQIGIESIFYNVQTVSWYQSFLKVIPDDSVCKKMGIVDGIETIHWWHNKYENVNESVNDCNVMCEWIHEWENWQHVFTIKIVKISQELHNSNILGSIL